MHACSAGRVGVVKRGCMAGTGVDDSSTTVPTRLRMGTTSRAPSRATIARPASRLLAALAMRAIAIRGGANHDNTTQHWPRRGAWTNAPCHTRTTSPPGRPTNKNWTAAPVGRVPEHDDENGIARASETVVGVLCAVAGGCVHDVHERGVRCGDVVVASALRSAVPTGSPLIPVLLSPAPASTIPFLRTPSLSFSIHASPSPGPSFLLLSVNNITLGTATASSLDLGGSIVSETVAILCLVAGSSPAVVHVAVASIEATRNRVTRTIAFLFLRLTAARGVHIHLNHSSSRTDGMCARAGSFASELGVPTVHHRGGVWASASSNIDTSGNPDALASLLLVLLRAFRDAGAGVHGSVAGSRTFRA